MKQTKILSFNRPHINLAHTWWSQQVKPGDRVVDATAGNGHDTLFLATLLQGQGALVAYDVQSEALEKTAERLSALSPQERSIVTLKLASHASLCETALALVVYNLGYLPSGDKSLTTRLESTLLSLERAKGALRAGGALSITCYPGHPEGKREKEGVVQWLSALPQEWQVTHHEWTERAPSWHCVQKPS